MREQRDSDTSEKPAELDLLVHWEPAWSGFVSAMAVNLRPGGVRSFSPTIPYGVRLRAPFASLVLHCAALLVCWIASPWLASIFPGTLTLTPPSIKPVAVTLYYFRHDLPEISDVSGSAPGHGPVSAGGEWFHPTQTIRIARGPKTTPAVIHAPNLRLPQVLFPANLLEFVAQTPLAPPPAALQSSGTSHIFLPSPAALPPPVVETPTIRRTGQSSRVELLPPADLKLSVAQPRLPTPVATLPSKSPGGEPDTTASSSARPADNPTKLASTPASKSPETGAGSSIVQLGGLMISVNPGNLVGTADPVEGSLAMSPSGEKGGAGGRGGTGRADSAGETGIAGAGSGGSGNAGADPNARAGASVRTGPGGAGVGSASPRHSPGGVLVVNGGYYIPSFSAPAINGATRKAAHMPPERLPAVVVVATPGASTTLDPEAALRGHRIYTTYFDTRIGSVVMQFADTTPSSARFEPELTAPAPILTDLPPDLRAVSAIIKCVVDTEGKLRDLRVIKTSSPELTTKLLDSLGKWLFRPVLSGADAIEVVATLGIPATIK